MKTNYKILSVALVFVLVVMIMTGCGIKRKELTFDNGNVLVTFNINGESEYKLSEDSNDLRTSREDAILLGDSFKIGIEIKEDLSFSKYSGSFDKLKEENKDKEEFEEVTYNGVTGFVRYYGSYTRYEIYLPIDGSDKYFVQLNVYSNEDTKESAKEQLESAKVKDILNNLTIKLK